jgi:hypothetical protein
MNANKLKKYLVMTAVVSGLAIIGGLMTPVPLVADKPNIIGPAGTVPVTVTNTPLPVTGSVAISNSPTVAIGNTPNVNIVNSPIVGLSSNASVHLNNTTPLLIQDSDNPARQPFQGTATWTITDGFVGVCQTVLTVPQNKKAVIEFVSAFIIVPGGQTVNRVQFIDRQLTGDITHELHPLSNGGSLFNVEQQLRVYADSNSLINVCPFRDQTAGAGSVLATVSGYLVNP